MRYGLCIFNLDSLYSKVFFGLLHSGYICLHSNGPYYFSVSVFISRTAYQYPYCFTGFVRIRTSYWLEMSFFLSSIVLSISFFSRSSTKNNSRAIFPSISLNSYSVNLQKASFAYITRSSLSTINIPSFKDLTITSH